MIKYEDIEKANQSLKSTTLKSKKGGKIGDYVEVNQRIKAFRQVYPMGTITAKIITLENGVVLMQATALDDEGKTLATGYASEKENSSFINSTSFIENCETSAIGRALGFCGFGIDSSVASAEEVENAMLNQGNQQKNNERKASPKQVAVLKKIYKGEDREKLLKYNNVEKLEDLSLTKASELISKNVEKEEKTGMSFNPLNEPWFNGKDY